jgi:hypothetical protein
MRRDEGGERDERGERREREEREEREKREECTTTCVDDGRCVLSFLRVLFVQH